MIRLYLTLEQKHHLRLVQDEARSAWNVLVGDFNAAVRLQHEAAERDGIIPPKPDKPAKDAGKAAWVAYYQTLSSRRRLAREHSPDLKMPFPRTDAETYKRLMAVWAETKKPQRMTANMYQALIQDFAASMRPKKGGSWRPPRFRRDTDDMPVRTGSGICIKPSGDSKRNALVHIPGHSWALGIAHRDLDMMVKGTLVQGVAFREQSDGWYAAVRVYVPQPVVIEWSVDQAVGVDINLDSLAVLSNGMRWENPRSAVADIAVPKDGAAPKIKRMPTDRVLGARIDNKWREAPERAVTRRARHVGNIVDQIVKHLLQYRYVAIEREPPSLEDIPRAQRSDPYVTAMGRLHTALVNRLGDRVMLVDAEYTSQECSQCGHRDKAAWSRRTGSGRHALPCTCPACGHTDDRDVNAAKNLVRKVGEPS
jgi:putative transposase